MTKPRKAVALLLLGPVLLATGGCCTLFDLFCGPDRSRWVDVSFESPESALATFMEAVRRDDSLVIYRCLGEGFKQRTDIKGSFEGAVVWEKVKEQVPFGAAHLLGTASVEGPERLAPDLVRYVLTRSGTRIALDLRRQSYWEVVWEESGEQIEDGAYVRSLGRFARVLPGADGSEVVIRFSSPELEETIDLASIRRAGVGHEWKVDGFAPAAEG